MLYNEAVNVIDYAIELNSSGKTFDNIENTKIIYNEYSNICDIKTDECIIETGSHFDYINFFKLYLGPILLVHKNPALIELVRRADIISAEEYLSIKYPLLSKLLSRKYKNKILKRIALRVYQFLTVSPISYFIYIKSFHSFIYFLAIKIKEIFLYNKQKKNLTERLLIDTKKFLSELTFNRVDVRWSEYHDVFNIASIINNENNWEDYYYNSDRATKIRELLDNSSPKSLLDLGANQGYFSFLAAKLGYSVQALDYDHGAIDKLYQHLLNTNFKYKIKPAIVNFKDITDTESERFSSDTTLALGFLHHMRLVELLSWEDIAQKLSDLTERKLITEFKANTGARKYFIKEDKKHFVNDYNLEDFLDSLRVHFRKVETCGSFSQFKTHSGMREIVVCEK